MKHGIVHSVPENVWRSGFTLVSFCSDSKFISPKTFTGDQIQGSRWSQLFNILLQNFIQLVSVFDNIFVKLIFAVS